MIRLLSVVAALITLSACGVGSVSGYVTADDAESEPRLAGTWQDAKAKESAVITAGAVKGSYEIVYTAEDAKVGRFHGRLGRIGAIRILDVEPVDPAPQANDVYRSLLLRAHGVIIIDSVTNVLAFRLMDADSLKAYLNRHPDSVRHALVDNYVLLTGSSEEVRGFLAQFARQSGFLGESEIWRRRQP